VKKLRVFLVFIILMVTTIGHTSLSEAEENCHFETMECLLAVELDTPETSAAIEKCLINDMLCLFFIGID
jgi:hypothetical protein